jgi:hypothetical protein
MTIPAHYTPKQRDIYVERICIMMEANKLDFNKPVPAEILRIAAQQAEKEKE